MKDYMEIRVIKMANFIVETNYTIRDIAIYFNTSKASVHKDLKERLPELDKKLDEKVKAIMMEHIKNRSVSGGESTKLKYAQMKKEKEKLHKCLNGSCMID